MPWTPDETHCKTTNVPDSKICTGLLTQLPALQRDHFRGLFRHPVRPVARENCDSRGRGDRLWSNEPASRTKAVDRGENNLGRKTRIERYADHGSGSQRDRTAYPQQSHCL